MLEYIGLGIAFLSSIWVASAVLTNSERTQKDFIFASFGFPSFIYVFISYVLGVKWIPQQYLAMPILFMSIGVLGVNGGRVIMSSRIAEEVKRDPRNFSIGVILNSVLETGAIFLLLTFILGQAAFEENDWTTILTSPGAFVQGMIIMGIFSSIGGVLVGYAIRIAIDKVRKKNMTLREGFRIVLIYPAVPQIIWVLGLLLTLLIYMGEITI